MDTMRAFAMGEANRGREMRVFDWDRAAKLIRDSRPEVASAGLADDWEYTGGAIYRDGAPVPVHDTYVFLASTWAAPELDLDDEVTECWRYESETPGWDQNTYWPESALAILSGDVIEGAVVTKEITA
jgi:hypothetical protein